MKRGGGLWVRTEVSTQWKTSTKSRVTGVLGNGGQKPLMTKKRGIRPYSQNSVVMSLGPLSLASSNVKRPHFISRNCGQCKTMYGRFFQGTACADACLAGEEGPNCFNQAMVSRFM